VSVTAQRLNLNTEGRLTTVVTSGNRSPSVVARMTVEVGTETGVETSTEAAASSRLPPGPTSSIPAKFGGGANGLDTAVPSPL
jgi:hypothetical protein